MSAWVHALGPENATGDLQITGRQPLAEAVLDGFAHAGARRAADAA